MTKHGAECHVLCPQHHTSIRQHHEEGNLLINTIILYKKGLICYNIVLLKERSFLGVFSPACVSFGGSSVVSDCMKFTRCGNQATALIQTGQRYYI